MLTQDSVVVRGGPLVPPWLEVAVLADLRTANHLACKTVAHSLMLSKTQASCESHGDMAQFDRMETTICSPEPQAKADLFTAIFVATNLSKALQTL